MLVRIIIVTKVKLLAVFPRRKWDREEYEKMAIERIEAEQRREGGYKDKDKDEPEPKRELLKARDYKVTMQRFVLPFRKTSA